MNHKKNITQTLLLLGVLMVLLIALKIVDIKTGFFTHFTETLYELLMG